LTRTYLTSCARGYRSTWPASTTSEDQRVCSGSALLTIIFCSCSPR
jgi:hypothetical protein